MIFGPGNSTVSRIIEQQMYRAVVTKARFSQCFDRLQFGDIGKMANRVDTLCAEIHHRGVERFLFDMGDNDLYALATKLFAEALPTPLAPPVITAILPLKTRIKY